MKKVSISEGITRNFIYPNIVDIGHIRSAIGLARLLVNQRFKQFSGLIKNCEDKVTPKGENLDTTILKLLTFYMKLRLWTSKDSGK